MKPIKRYYQKWGEYRWSSFVGHSASDQVPVLIQLVSLTQREREE